MFSTRLWKRKRRFRLSSEDRLGDTGRRSKICFSLCLIIILRSIEKLRKTRASDLATRFEPAVLMSPRRVRTSNPLSYHTSCLTMDA